MADLSVKQKRVNAAQKEVDRLSKLVEKDQDQLRRLNENYAKEKDRIEARREDHSADLKVAREQLTWVSTMPVREETETPLDSGMDETEASDTEPEELDELADHIAENEPSGRRAAV
jgi:hypothetical protein